MKELTVEESRKIQLKILKEFDLVCRNNNIDYSLDGGTLLGSIRHKGFIPWDDDIDVIFTPHNAKKFFEYCQNNKTPFKVINNNIDPKFSFFFSRLYDDNTLIKGDWTKDINHGVHIDVLTLIPIGNDLKYFKKISKLLAAFHKIALRKRGYITNLKDKNILVQINHIFLCLLSSMISTRKLYEKYFSFFKDKNWDNSKYISLLEFHTFRKRIFETKYFNEYSEGEFEGSNFMIFKNYDYYLTQLYGDYMQLPPVEERKSLHLHKFYNKN